MHNSRKSKVSPQPNRKVDCGKVDFVFVQRRPLLSFYVDRNRSRHNPKRRLRHIAALVTSAERRLALH
jgi:hypothetical protein